MKNLLIHIPHSSTYIPEDIRTDLLLSDQELERELLVMTDHHLDEMADGIDAGTIVYPFSRLVADPERFRDDESEEMSEKGLGAVYTQTHDGRPLRRRDPGRREELLRQYYDPHHRDMEQTVSGILERSGSCLIVDLHSYPSDPLPYELHKNARRPDICIGSDLFHTPPNLVKGMLDFFQDKNLTVVENEPFQGSFVPLPFYREDPHVSSVMIEFKRSLYMDEATGIKSPMFSRIEALLSELVREIT